MSLPEKNHLWLVGEIVKTPDGAPPTELAWTCAVCGPQPPVALAGNRWVKRSCACEREEGIRQRQTKAALEVVEKAAKQRYETVPPLTRLGSLLPALAQPTMPPPEELCWTCEVCGPIVPLFLPRVQAPGKNAVVPAKFEHARSKKPQSSRPSGSVNRW